MSSAWKDVSFVDPVFLGVFLPIVLLAFYALHSLNLRRGVPVLLVCASLLFYASWGAKFFIIFVASMLANFTARAVMLQPGLGTTARRSILIGIVAGNLACLGYFKYSGLILGTISSLGGFQASFANVAIPLGISFYTFQEITLAVDAYRGARQGSFLKYVLFISFFPHLVAGPLVHHREMMPQFNHFRFRWHNIAFGVCLIGIGLFKKTCLADPLAPFVQSVFDAPGTVSSAAAWLATLAYGFQLYFDFSGYSDMALGLGRLFGVRLPINFNSPYKADSIIDFWRRWHLSLSRFLREYLYVPLGGNRLGEGRRYANLMFVMLVGGLWHGPNWTFLAWGGLHGIFLVVNHAWISVWGGSTRLFGGYGGRLLTFVCVMIAWVPFRAPTFAKAQEIWLAMAGFSENGFAAMLTDQKLQELALWLCVLLLITQVLPNSMQIMRIVRPYPGPAAWAPQPAVWLRWNPTVTWMAIAGVFVGLSIGVGRYLPKHFLYWNF